MPDIDALNLLVINNIDGILWAIKNSTTLFLDGMENIFVKYVDQDIGLYAKASSNIYSLCAKEQNIKCLKFIKEKYADYGIIKYLCDGNNIETLKKSDLWSNTLSKCKDVKKYPKKRYYFYWKICRSCGTEKMNVLN